LEAWHGPSLALPFVVALDRPETRNIVAADVDSDGHLDIVAVSQVASRTDVYLGRGDGTFAPPAATPIGTAPDHFIVSDLNADGAPDLAMTGFPRLTVLSHPR